MSPAKLPTHVYPSTSHSQSFIYLFPYLPPFPHIECRFCRTGYLLKPSVSFSTRLPVSRQSLAFSRLWVNAGGSWWVNEGLPCSSGMCSVIGMMRCVYWGLSIGTAHGKCCKKIFMWCRETGVGWWLATGVMKGLVWAEPWTGCILQLLMMERIWEAGTDWQRPRDRTVLSLVGAGLGTAPSPVLMGLVSWAAGKHCLFLIREWCD